MTQMLIRPRPKRNFSRADVLSELGETICFYECEAVAAELPENLTPVLVSTRYDEDPERWDGLS